MARARTQDVVPSPRLLARGGICAVVGVALLVWVAASLTGCTQHEVAPTEVAATHVAQLPTTLDDPSWETAATFRAPLILQDMVEPRLMEASTREVRVQALTDGSQVAFRLSWDDATHNDLPGTARFTDACAVQLPREPGADLPAPQMGEAGKAVEITYWKADWQAEVDGRPLEIETLYPNASIDHYPFEAPSLQPGSEEQRAMAKRFAPAKAAGRPTHPPDRPVQDLIAEGPGTITAAPRTLSQGWGERQPAGWQVVLSRPLPAALRQQARTQVAFAIWDGSHQEVGARKMRSAWIPFSLEAH